MTMYVWRGVLCDYTCGMAAVEADSVEDAYDQVRQQRDSGELKGYVADELLANEPEEENEVAWIYGGA